MQLERIAFFYIFTQSISKVFCNDSDYKKEIGKVFDLIKTKTEALRKVKKERILETFLTLQEKQKQKQVNNVFFRSYYINVATNT